LTEVSIMLVRCYDASGLSLLFLSVRSSSGTELMCCSWDGTVAYFEFSIDEIGNPMTLEEKV